MTTFLLATVAMITKNLFKICLKFVSMLSVASMTGFIITKALESLLPGNQSG